MSITQERVKFLFDYKDGKLFWKNKSHPRSHAHVGSEAGGSAHHGYKSISIDGKRHYLHRIVFLYHHGYFPEVIDHIDNNQENNQIENLRAVSHSENMRNSRIKANNKLGVKNVTFDDKACKYRVQIRSSNKQLYIGSYEDLEFAEFVAIEARNKYHNEFARHA